jgi:hypothetical protein
MLLYAELNSAKENISPRFLLSAFAYLAKGRKRRLTPSSPEMGDRFVLV